MSKKIAMVIASQNFRDEEYKEPRQELVNAGIDVTVFSSSNTTSKGMFGFEVTPDDLIENINPADFNGIVFLGGSGASEYFDSHVAHNIAKEFNKKNKLVAAICIAPKTLAKAGLLKNKKACCFPSVKDDLKELGVLVQPDGVVQDENIITGTGPEYATHFGKALVQYLS